MLWSVILLCFHAKIGIPVHIPCQKWRIVLCFYVNIGDRQRFFRQNWWYCSIFTRRSVIEFVFLANNGWFWSDFWSKHIILFHFHFNFCYLVSFLWCLFHFPYSVTLHLPRNDRLERIRPKLRFKDWKYARMFQSNAIFVFLDTFSRDTRWKIYN